MAERLGTAILQEVAGCSGSGGNTDRGCLQSKHDDTQNSCQSHSGNALHCKRP
jgi:hypothetical protein